MSRLLPALCSLGVFYVAIRALDAGVPAWFGLTFFVVGLGLWTFAVRGEEREWRAW